MLMGVRRAYFCFPVAPGVIDGTAYFARAARAVDVEAIVNMSQRSARSDAKSHAAQDHWVAERVFDRFDTPVTHLQPGFFAERFLYFSYRVRAGVVWFPFGTGRHAPVAADDHARVIAAGRADPETHGGKVYPSPPSSSSPVTSAAEPRSACWWGCPPGSPTSA